MNQFYADYLDRLSDLHTDCRAAMKGLPQEAIDWKPVEGMNSIGVLIVHLVGADRYWFGDVIMGEPSGRQREKEFISHGLDANELSARLAGSFDYIRGSLETLKLEDLPAQRISPRDGQVCTVGWAMLQVLRHTASHLGHMEDARHWWLSRG
jgi:uncharacterized damage-inducible protein DinB